ncbi:MAG: Crp/Fnr family transcriptional regulator [Acidobacteria bacterium]|nr:Crp/Fnr family transcriptional regulator [Acidobacteriota bacterium]
MSMAQVRCEELVSVDRVWHLRQSGLLDGLALSDLNAVLSSCRDRIYTKGEIIFDQGDPADSLFILNRGCVRISVVSPQNREKILGLYTAGILGENVLGPNQFFHARATAHEESWVSIISRDQFAILIQQRVPIAINYARILSQRLLEAQEDIKSHSFLDTEHRLGRLLLKVAERHGQPLFRNQAVVKLKIALSHEYLAQLVGGNRPHVSMIMSKFKSQGWIDYQGRKLLIHREAMEGWLQAPDNGVPSPE